MTRYDILVNIDVDCEVTVTLSHQVRCPRHSLVNTMLKLHECEPY